MFTLVTRPFRVTPEGCSIGFRGGDSTPQGDRFFFPERKSTIRKAGMTTQFGTKTRRTVALVASVGALGLGGVALAAPASADNTFCGWTPANNTQATGHFTTAVNIRTGGNTDCAVLAVGQPSDHLEVRCGAQSPDGAWWDYLVDNERNVVGWAADVYVSWQGTPRHC